MTYLDAAIKLFQVVNKCNPSPERIKRWRTRLGMFADMQKPYGP